MRSYSLFNSSLIPRARLWISACAAAESGFDSSSRRALLPLSLMVCRRCKISSRVIPKVPINQSVCSLFAQINGISQKGYEHLGDLIEQGADCNSEKQSSFESKADED